MQLGVDSFQPNSKLRESNMIFVVEIWGWEVGGVSFLGRTKPKECR